MRFSFNSWNHSVYYGGRPMLAEQIRAAAAAGFDSIGLDLPSIRAHAAAGLGLESLRAVLDDAGITCYELVPLSLGGDATENHTLIDEAVATAAALGAEQVLTAVRGEPGEVVVASLAEAAAALADVGAAASVEFMPLNAVATIDDALALLERAGDDRLQVLVDIWHLALGPSDWASFEAMALERLGFVQLDDAAASATGTSLDDCMERRLMPGDGALPLERFAASLRRIGWDGVVSVEVLSSAWRQRPLDEFAAAALASAQRWARTV